MKLAEWLKAKNLEIICLDKKVGNEDILTYSPSLIISYNYRYIISRKIIELMNGNIINLHISFLPWNRGANPNFWSFVEKTPKGVTIHKIDEGLDTGPIILQKEIEIDDRKNTFRSSYEVLHSIIQELFRKNYLDIMNGLTIERT